MTDEKKEIARDLEEIVEDAQELARGLGLDPYPVNYWVVDHDEMNELIAYGGFQERYPHWRWGMKYDRQKKERQYLGGKAFEIVNNDNPAHAFLQKSNSLADQKSVITHVEAHSDFFKNNQWFKENPEATSKLAQHSQRIEEYMDDPDISREDVEWWIDTILCIEDNINQYSPFMERSTDEEAKELKERVDNIGVSDDVKDELFDEEWFDEQDSGEEPRIIERDLLKFFIENGKQYDEEEGKAKEYEDWQKEVMDMIRDEAYYFAPQKMTKVANEGWASFWESIMMADEGFASEDEFIEYSDHLAKVLASPGFNPYSLGLQIWRYIENRANRREVTDKLLRIEGVKPENFRNEIDFEKLQDLINHPDSSDFAKRHYSLAKPQNRGFIRNIPQSELNETYRYMFDTDKYSSLEEAIEEIDYEAGWKKMRNVRESNNDVTFLDNYITDEFIEKGDYFAYEYNDSEDEFQVSSTEPKEVKKKLLLQFTNFGKPTITVSDGNHKNKGYLLLHHEYNGVMLDWAQAQETLKRVFHLWGRPVHLKTIVKNPKTGDEEGRMMIYDGEEISVESLDWEEVEDIAAGEIDYSTKPDDW